MRIGLKGGYNVFFQGRPDRTVKVLPEPKVLYLPLRSRRFVFSETCVKDGRRVSPGDVLARDPDNYAVPLLTPRAGTARLKQVEDHILLTDISPPPEKTHLPEKDLPHIVKEMGAAGIKRYKLLSLGAWQFFYDAYTGALPDPLGTPQAVIVSTLSLEPFVARGDAQLKNCLLQFTRGLEHMQSLLEYQPIYLIIPDISSDFATQVREHIRGYAWAKIIEVPVKYPYDNFNILARSLGLKKDAGPVWSVRTEGVLAIDRTLTISRSSLVRIVTIGGPGVKSPVHLKAMTGYPIEAVVDMYASAPNVRVIIGGAFSGRTAGPEVLGLDAECSGLTVFGELQEREFLGFIRPGWDRQSYSGCFLSALRKKFNEQLTPAIRGEPRPCIACNFCDEVCPAGIMPHLIHKYLYRDLIEEAEQARVDLCVECGLCSFVCPSKIELMSQFIAAKERIREEKEEERRELVQEKSQ